MITIKKTTDLSSTIYKDALDIRKEVFIKEQLVPIEIEIDKEDITRHFVLYEDDSPQATVRLLPTSTTSYKIQRMAVKKPSRKKGYGRTIMSYLETYVKEQDGNELVLGAQVHAIPFYQRIGYQVVGEIYFEAGIEHVDMKKTLP